METKVLSFEQMPELIQNLVERIEALEMRFCVGEVMEKVDNGLQ